MKPLCLALGLLFLGTWGHASSPAYPAPIHSLTQNIQRELDLLYYHFQHQEPTPSHSFSVIKKAHIQTLAKESACRLSLYLEINGLPPSTQTQHSSLKQTLNTLYHDITRLRQHLVTKNIQITPIKENQGTPKAFLFQQLAQIYSSITHLPGNETLSHHAYHLANEISKHLHTIRRQTNNTEPIQAPETPEDISPAQVYQLTYRLIQQLSEDPTQLPDRLKRRPVPQDLTELLIKAESLLLEKKPLLLDTWSYHQGETISYGLMPPDVYQEIKRALYLWKTLP